MKIKQLMTFFLALSFFSPLLQAATDTQDTPIVKSGTPRSAVPGTGGISGAAVGIGVTVLAVAAVVAVSTSGNGNNAQTLAAPTGTN